MDKKTLLLTSGIMYVTLAIGATVLWFNSHPGRWIALGLYGALVLLILCVNYRQRRYGRYSSWLLIAGLALALVIQYFDATLNSGFYFIVLIAMALFHKPLRFSAPFAAAAMLLSIVPMLYASGFDFALFWNSRSSYILPRLFMLAGIVIARYAIITSNKNSELAQRLRENSEKLEEALEQLQASMEELKETADLRARETLMRELHDKLGHLLTTALIGAQASEVLIDKDAQAAKERLNLAAEQIRQAMQALRHVITGGSLLDDEQGLAHSLMRLMSETETHAGVVIRCDLDGRDAEALDALPVHIRTFFYNALTEGLTNGIRHGEAKHFDFSLAPGSEGWTFVLRDDGKGFSRLRPGVGLSKMRRDAAKLGGSLRIDSSNGCTLAITLPGTAGEEALIEQN